MNPSARVDSIEAIADFRAALWKFAEIVQAGIDEAEADIHRTMAWVDRDRRAHWKRQRRQRAEAVNQAKLALSQKRLYKTPTGGRYSTVEEEQALARAKRRLEEAEQKIDNVKRWNRALEKEAFEHKAQVRPLVRSIELDIPNAVAHLDRLVVSLESYAAVVAPSADRGESAAVSVARDGSPLGPSSTWRALRDRTPTRFVRDRLTPGRTDFPWSPDCRIDDAGRRALAALVTTPDRPAPGAKVVLARDVWKTPVVYFERVAASPDVDSGWFVGSLEPADNAAFEAVSVRDLLESRPDLAELLELPAGTLAVIDRGSIVAILDASDRQLMPTGGGGGGGVIRG